MRTLLFTVLMLASAAMAIRYWFLVHTGPLHNPHLCLGLAAVAVVTGIAALVSYRSNRQWKQQRRWWDEAEQAWADYDD